jgi:hypothetical protein
MNGTNSTLERRNQPSPCCSGEYRARFPHSLEPSLLVEPDFIFLLQRVTSAREGMSGPMADLIEERLRSLPVGADSNEMRADVAEMIDIVHSYLSSSGSAKDGRIVATQR